MKALYEFLCCPTCRGAAPGSRQDRHHHWRRESHVLDELFPTPETRIGQVICRENNLGSGRHNTVGILRRRENPMSEMRGNPREATIGSVDRLYRFTHSPFRGVPHARGEAKSPIESSTIDRGTREPPKVLVHLPQMNREMAAPRLFPQSPNSCARNFVHSLRIGALSAGFKR